jgi:hypothetical protein
MRFSRALAFALVGSAAVSSTAFADVQLTIQNGRVSLIAKDATVRQVLTEWARIGQTRVVNLDKISGGPVTLQLTDVSEEQAIRVLLRTVSGYVLAPRQAESANLSRFERIIVMPASTAPPAAASARPPFGQVPQPGFQPPQFPVPPTVAEDDADDDDRMPPNGGFPPPNNRGPAFNTFPQPQMVTPGNPLVLPPGLPGVFNPPQPGGASANPSVYQPQHVTPSPTPTGGFPNMGVQPGRQPQQQAQPPAATPAPFPTAPFGGVTVPGTVAPAPTTPQQQQGLPRPVNPNQ